MSGRTAKRLRGWLYELRHKLGESTRGHSATKRLRGWLYELRHKLGESTRGHSATKRQLSRAWAALSGRDRGLVSALGWRPVRAADRLFEGVPVAQRAAAKERTGKRGGTGLLHGHPRTGGPARHPGKAWLRARRERLAGGRS